MTRSFSSCPPGCGTGVLIGYASVSTEDQKLDLQHDALGQLGCHRVFEDRASGARTTAWIGRCPFPSSRWGHPRCPAPRSARPHHPSTRQPAGAVRARGHSPPIFSGWHRPHFGDGERPCSGSGPFSQKWNAICCGADESRLDLAEHCEGNHRPDCPIIDDLSDLILEKPVSATLRDVA